MCLVDPTVDVESRRPDPGNKQTKRAIGLLTEVDATLAAAFINPRAARKRIEAFKQKHGLQALISELKAAKRHRFGREPGGFSSGNYFSEEGKRVREMAVCARKTLPVVLRTYFDAQVLQDVPASIVVIDHASCPTAPEVQMKVLGRHDPAAFRTPGAPASGSRQKENALRKSLRAMLRLERLKTQAFVSLAEQEALNDTFTHGLAELPLSSADRQKMKTVNRWYWTDLLELFDSTTF